MKVITREIGEEILASTGFVLIALVALFSFFDLVGQASRIGSRYDVWSALELTALNIPFRIYQVMPIAALLGAVYTLSRWASHSEFTILRMAGLSPAHFARMLAFPAVILMAFTFAMSEWAPYTDKMHMDKRNELLGRTLSARGYASGVWVKDIAKDKNGNPVVQRFVNVQNLVSGQDSRTGAWRVFEFDAKDNSLKQVIRAGRANFIPKEGWHLEKTVIESVPKIGRDEKPMAERAQYRNTRHYLLKSDMQPEILGVMTVKPEDMGSLGLYRYINHLKENRQSVDRYEITFWRKVLYPLTILAMLAVAMPFAYLNARSGGMSAKIFAGVMVGITFYAFNQIFAFIGTINTWPPMVVALFPTIVMLIVASLALWVIERR